MKSSKFNKIILFTVILSFIFTVTASAAEFKDISDHWAKEYIERVAKLGLVTGYDDKTFKPDANVTILESLVMLSRLYEIEDDLKDEIIEKHEEFLEKLPNSRYYEWSFDYLSLVIDLGIVSEKGVEDMFSKKTIFNEATREEVAVLLTKAMMLDLKKAFVLPFNDLSKIDDAAKPYIYALYDRDILQGDNKNNFNPKNKITRAELSVLLDKAYKYIEDNDIYPDFDDYKKTTVVEGLITKLSEEKAESYLYIRDYKGVESIVKVNNDTDIYVNGKLRDFSQLKTDMIVTCKIDEERNAVKIETDTSKKIVKGIISYVAFSEPSSITIYDEDDNKLKFDVSSNIDIYLDGEKVALKKLEKDDEITLFLDNNKVYQINSSSSIKYYNGKITSIDYTSYPIKLSIETDTGVKKTFTFNGNVEVTRNDEASNFDRVRVGDEVKVTTKYDEMIKINTVTKEAEMNGTIKEILIGPVNKIKIADKNGDVKQYIVSNNVVITIGDKNASIYDLRLGYNVNINTSGDEIVTMEVSELQTAMNFAGKIIFLNKDDKLIMMQNINSNGQAELIYLKVTNNTRIFNTAGETKYLKDLNEGKNIMSTAISQGGEYIAISIMLQ